MQIISIQFKNETGIWESTDCLDVNTDIQEHPKTQDISIIPINDWKMAQNSLQKGFCHHRFKPNLILESLPESQSLRRNDQELGIGNARLLVLQKKHRCHESCPLASNEHNECVWTKNIYYARVIKGGRMCEKDRVILLSHSD